MAKIDCRKWIDVCALNQSFLVISHILCVAMNQANVYDQASVYDQVTTPSCTNSFSGLQSNLIE